MKLQPGFRVGPYEILSLLGSGGMGDVYRSRDTVLGREVALKILPPEFTTDAVRLARFQQEARLASSLNHPNIVTIYGVGTHDEISYIAMELVPGKTLAELLKAGPLPFDKAVDIAAQAADGMAKAHSAGIVHRDLKPQNIMVNEDGLVKILDFGLSKAVPGAHSLSSLPTVFDSTGTGVIMGTAKYMSPEQAAGKTLDFRSDQFSFGAVLYEMLSGRPPFERDTVVQILSSIIEDEPTPVSDINVRTPENLEAIVQRCMSKDPTGRYSSTQILAADLQGARNTLREAKLQVKTRLKRTWKRHWRAVAVGVLALGAAVAAVRLLSGRRGDEFRVVSIPAQKQLAILPFTSLDGGAANQAFLDGLAETMSSRLGQLEQYQTGLQVIPASEVQRQSVTTPQAARQSLGATLVINGSVNRTPESLRLTLALIDPKEMRQLRSSSIDVRLDDSRALQEGMLVRAAEMLEIDVKPEARKLLSIGGTSAAAAYDAYLRGRGYLRRYDKVESMESAIGAFEEAVSRDSNYPLAYAGLCEAFWRKYDLTKDTVAIDQARPNCSRAVVIGGDIASVHVADAMLHTATGEYDDAVQEARRAIEIDPANADGYRELANAYQQMGKSEEAEAIYKKVAEVRPNDFLTHMNLGSFYYRRGRYSDAAGEYRELIRLTPENPRPYSNLGGIYIVLKRDDEAIEMLQKSLDLQPSAAAYSNLGVIYYRQSKYEDAARNFELSVKMNPNDYTKWRNLAEAYSWIPGDETKSRDAYRHTVELCEKQLQVNPKDANLLKDLAESYVNLGEPRKAENSIRQALAIKKDDPQVLKTAAAVYDELGDRNRALDFIAQAFRAGLPRDAIDNNPGMTKLRADPRFQALRER